MVENIETAGDYHWRNSMKPVMFFNLDARSVFPFLLLLMHARWWTLYLCVVVTIAFMVVNKFGLTLPSALRALRNWLIGDKRPAWMFTRKSTLKDYHGF